MNKDVTSIRSQALDFLKTHNAGVLATVSSEGNPHASAIYYIADDSFNVYFLTKLRSRKFAAIQAHPTVAFTVGRLDVPQTIQIEGVAIELQNNEEKRSHGAELMNKLIEINPYYLPIAKMDSDVVVMWLQPKWIRWGDFSTEGTSDETIFTEIPTP